MVKYVYVSDKSMNSFGKCMNTEFERKINIDQLY